MPRLWLLALIAAVGLMATGCDRGDKSPTHVDRIESCLQKAGIDARQGWFAQVAGPATGENARAVFVGPSEAPTVTVVPLTDQLLESYRTQLGKAALTSTHAVIVARNVLLQPRQSQPNRSYQSRRGPKAIGPFPHIDLITDCAATTREGTRSEPARNAAREPRRPRIVAACGTISAGDKILDVDLAEGRLPATCSLARQVMRAYINRIDGGSRDPDGCCSKRIRAGSKTWDCYKARLDGEGWDYHCSRLIDAQIPFKNAFVGVAAGRRF